MTFLYYMALNVVFCQPISEMQEMRSTVNSPRTVSSKHNVVLQHCICKARNSGYCERPLILKEIQDELMKTRV